MQEEQLFYDTLSGQYFTSSISDIMRIQNEINRRSLDTLEPDRYFDKINMLRNELGLPVLQDHWVYFVDDNRRRLLDLKFEALMGSNDKPVIMVDFNIHKTKYKVKVRRKGSA